MKNKTDIFSREILIDDVTGGKIIRYIHPCGFSLQYIPKPKFSKKFASILVPFGSVNSSVRSNGEIFDFPAGSAHYMEHCIFSKDESGGLLARLSSLGASANAYTSNTHTLYYFTSVENFFDSLKLYFSCVLNPYLEDDRVEAERNVIIQELEMYEDDPDSKSYRDLLQSLYSKHPIRDDIGGTKETVNCITSKHLKKIKELFYSLSEISMTIVGDVEEDEIRKFLEEIDFKFTIQEHHFDNIFPEETDIICEKKVSRKMDVDVESFIIGIKNPFINSVNSLSGRQRIKMQKGGQLYLETLLGNSSEIFEDMFSRGLINESFGFHYVCEKTYGYFIASGESPEPELAAKTLYDLLQNKLGGKLEKEEFEFQKRVVLGNFIRSFDAVEHCGLSAAAAKLSDTNIFEYPDLFARIDPFEILESLEFMKNENLLSEAFIFMEDK